MTKPTMEMLVDYGIEKWAYGATGEPDNADKADALISEIRQRLEAMERDAARYRWLEGQASQKTAYDVYGRGGLWATGTFSDDSRLGFGAAIDAAMAGGQG